MFIQNMVKYGESDEIINKNAQGHVRSMQYCRGGIFYEWIIVLAILRAIAGCDLGCVAKRKCLEREFRYEE